MEIVEAARRLRTGHIADPVHRYIDFTAIEHEIFKHCVTQRLRNISQSGLAHLVFPELRSSRFSHSLGAMHLASRFLAASFSNSSPTVRKDLGAALAEDVALAAGLVHSGDAFQSFQEEDLQALLAHRCCLQDHVSAVKVAEQALRLAALFHDLGHLPFSHDFEYALQDYWWIGLSDEERRSSPLLHLVGSAIAAGEKPHERLGHGLALLMFNDVFADVDDQRIREAVRISFNLAARILMAGRKPRPADPKRVALRWLHALIDGDVDVDRCDYLLRDGRNYGFEFATYDLDRLFDNITVVDMGSPKDPSPGTAAYELAIKEQGLSALETYFLARFRSYQYGVRHHKVAQIGAGLRRVVRGMLESANRPTELNTFIDDISCIGEAVEFHTKNDTLPVELSNEHKRRELLKRVASYDDIWWMGLMRRYSRELEAQGGTQTDDLLYWLELVCWRGRARSLWKRCGDLPQDVRDRIYSWNAALPQEEDFEAQAEWRDMVRALEREGVVVLRHEFSPWKADETGKSALRVQFDDRRIEPASDASPLIRRLRKAWMNDLQVHAFVAAPDCRVTRDDVLSKLREFVKSVRKRRVQQAQ